MTKIACLVVREDGSERVHIWDAETCKVGAAMWNVTNVKGTLLGVEILKVFQEGDESWMDFKSDYLQPASRFSSSSVFSGPLVAKKGGSGVFAGAAKWLSSFMGRR